MLLLYQTPYITTRAAEPPLRGSLTLGDMLVSEAQESPIPYSKEKRRPRRLYKKSSVGDFPITSKR